MRKMMVFVGGSQDKHNRALTCFDPVSRKNYYSIPLHISYDFKYRIDHHRAVVTDKNEIYLLGKLYSFHYNINCKASDTSKCEVPETNV